MKAQICKKQTFVYTYILYVYSNKISSTNILVANSFPLISGLNGFVPDINPGLNQNACPS